MKRFINSRVVMLLVLVMVVCLTGLTGDSMNNTVAAAVKKPKQGGSLKIAADNSPTTFFMPKSETTGNNKMVMPAVESLGRLNSKGVYEPWLAEAFSVDPNKLTFTIKLRPNVLFHDGSKLTAEVVKWNFEQMIKNGKESELSNPKSFEIVDDRTLVIRFAEWANNWQDVISDVQIISKEAYEKHGEAWCAINCVGTGPFVLEKYVQGSKLQFKRFNNYRIKGLPYLDNLEIDIIPDLNTEISAFLNKEVDCLMTNDAVAIRSLEGAGFKNTGKKSPNLADIDYFLFNSKDPAVPFSKLEVRQAVMHSIDYKNVARALTGGLGFATNQFGIEGAYSYNPTVKFYPYNLKKAKELLKKAGYPNGFATTIFTRADLKQTAEALQASIKPIGINAKIQVLDKALLNKMQTADSMQGIVIGKGASQLDFTKNYIRLYSSEGIKNQGLMIFPADYEKALFGARAAKTLAEKKQLLQIASKKLVEEYCLLVPLDVAFYQSFTQKNVYGLGMYEVSLQAWTPEAAWVE